MVGFFETFVEAFWSYGRSTLYDLGQPSLGSFLWWLLALTALVFALELVLPWRRTQRAFREDFWLDLFYVGWNAVIFPLLGFHAAGVAVWSLVRPLLALMGLEQGLLPVGSWPLALQLGLLFLLRDFLHWNIHRLLHGVSWLWQFHKVHHSVREMGVAAHLRYHWMENVVYRALEAVPIAILGFSFESFLGVGVMTLAVGHLNHANLYLPVGPLRYIINTPQMHIWHHARSIPEGRSGVNFGITLSVWDWLFGTAWWPRKGGEVHHGWDSGRDARLGFPGDETFPRGLGRQLLWPLVRN